MSSFILKLAREFAASHTELDNAHLALCVAEQFSLTYAMAIAIVESL